MNDPRAPRADPPTQSSLRPAATTILLREHDDEAQVLLTRRHAGLAFMGGMWVFPGGTLSSADAGDAARRIVMRPDQCVYTLRDLAGRSLPQQTCLGLAVAALRETFEETGILLATRSDGAAPHVDQLARLQEERVSLASDPELFIAAIAREQLMLDAPRLLYWAHWITPSALARRFDTRFFVARAPASATFAADSYETSECVWMSPAELLDRAARNEMKIAQPTRYTLEDLRVSIRKHGTLDALLRAEREREVTAIMPKLISDDGSTKIVMPWDTDYEALPGEGVPVGQQRYEPALLALPSRIERDH